MVFMNIINKALEDRNTKLKEVSSKITECNTQIKNKEDQVKVLEEEFKHTFDINITGKVNGINAEIKELESTVETLRKAFDYTLRVKPDNDVVLDLNKKCDELSLEALRDNIIKSQEDYLNCLKEYSQKTSELTTIRTEIVRAEKNIDPDIIKIIDEWFKKKSSELYLHSKVISYECSGEEQGLVLNIRHNIERLAGSNDPFKFE